MKHVKASWLAALPAIVFGGGVALAPATARAQSTEILWDTYGVPHIFASTREGMFYAHGWAQMQNQANLLLRLYGESRARGAEYWGEEFAALDRWLVLNGMPDLAKVWYDAQTPTFRTYMDEFARGINEFARAHPQAIDPQYQVVLPVSGVDVVGHALRVVHYGYMATTGDVRSGANAELRRLGIALEPGETDTQLAFEPGDPFAEAPAGSNTWSIGPAHSASGNAMLLINPHLSWGDTFYRYMEVHLVGPNYDLYGAPQVGFPVPVVGFNRRAGWSRTVNTIDTVDFFRLSVVDGQYMFDSEPNEFVKQTRTIKIKQPDGSLKEEKIEIRRTVHGPVVYDERGVTLAMRVAGLDRPKMLEQWFRMGEAQNLEQFQDALRMGSVPMWNANYADADGHIMLVFNGLVARRSEGDYNLWNGVVDGTKSWTLWTDYLTFEELPKSIDPTSGWNQNTNEPPWLTTFPTLKPSDYPAYVAPNDQAQPQMRTLRSLRMITEDPKISYQQLIEKKHSTRMELADRVLPDLLAAGKGSTEALRVLERWDHNTDVGSRGAVLFQAFVNSYLGQGLAGKMRVKYDPAHPLESAQGLADPQAALAALEQAAAQTLQTYGSLDVPWGDVYRFTSGKANLPANGGAGGSGLFRTITFTRGDDNRYYPSAGETIVCAVEFAGEQQAQCLLGYGNATQAGNVHREDQLPLMVEKRLHPVWRERAEIEQHLEGRERF
jgi:acyl-homoserine-lactone acylase